MLPNRCQDLNKFVWKSHKYWTFQDLFLTQTRQKLLCTKQICLRVFARFDINSFQLSNMYRLAEPMLSDCYHKNVITFLVKKQSFFAINLSGQRR